MMMVRKGWFEAVLGVLLGMAGVANAEPVDEAARAKARLLGYAGVEAYAAGDYVDANAKLDESFRLLSVPSLGLWSARTLVKLGRLVEAEERYRVVSSIAVSEKDPPAQQTAKHDAARERAELLSRIPILKVRVTGAALDEVQVKVDGRPWASAELSRALLVNPGRHTVVGTRGTETSEVVVRLAEGMHEEVSLRFSLPPAAAPLAVGASGPAALAQQDPARDALRTGAWIAVGAGAAALLTGTVAYVLGEDQYDGFERRGLCREVDACSQEEVDAYHTLRTLHLGAFIAGGVLSAAGATVLVVTTLQHGDAAAQSQIGVRVGPGSASIVGSF